MSTDEDVGLEEVMVTVRDKYQEGMGIVNRSGDIGDGGGNVVWYLRNKNNSIHL